MYWIPLGFHLDSQGKVRELKGNERNYEQKLKANRQSGFRKRQQQQRKTEDYIMAKKDVLTDEEVELEIARLLESPYVKLAQREYRVKNRRRKYFWQLTYLEKKGKKLAEEGVTMDTLNKLESECEEDVEVLK